jgi:hypothetical protein
MGERVVATTGGGFLLRRGCFFPVAMLLWLILFPGSPAVGAEMEPVGVVTGDGVRVRYAEGLKGAARETVGRYPGVKADLEETFGWALPVTATVYLAGDREGFGRMAGNTRVVAVAWTARNRILMDWSRVNRDPFTLSETLKHEVCHLLLHHHIREEHLPRWLDEGLCQWVSDGLTELTVRASEDALQQAVLTGGIYALDDLTQTFPAAPQKMALAYAQGKSVVEYLIRRYGVEGLIGMLDHLKQGHDLATALDAAFSLSPERLERNWRRHLSGRVSWLTWVASHLYQILFFVAAVAAAVGFFRQVQRRRRYKDEEEE